MFFFFNDTATTEIYTLSLHDALPISHVLRHGQVRVERRGLEHHGQVALARGDVVDCPVADADGAAGHLLQRSEEHTSELQSRQYLVCRLLLEKKKKKTIAKMFRLSIQ